MDSSDLLSTPTGYATPTQLQAQRDYAQALLHGSGQQPKVQSWTQGVSNMVAALMGGGLLNQAGNQERGGLQQAAQQRFTPQVPTPGAAPNPLEGRTSDGQTNSDGDTDKAAKAIAGIESKGSGDYSAMGPVTHTGDRAYGKYQVMGANIPSWTREVLGKEMTPEEFLSNQAAQDKVFQTKFAQGGNNDSDRASVWFTGKPLAQGANRSDGNLTGAQYVQKFNTAMGAPSGGGGAMAFAGPDGASQNPAVAAMGAALRNDPQVAQNTQVAAGKAVAPTAQTVMPQPNGTGIYFNPNLIKPPPQYNADQVRGALANPYVPESVKAEMLKQYQMQSQPIEMPYPGGHVLIDRNDPRKQQFIPDLQKNTTEYPDGYKPGGVYTVTPGTGGTLQTNPALEAPTAAGPRSEAQPSAAPTAGPQPTAPGAAAVAQSAPAAPVTAPATAQAAAPNAPVQVASLDPNAGFKAAAAGAAPPSAPGVQVAENAAPVTPPTNPMAQAIRTKPPGDIPQRDWNVITGFQDLNRQNEIDKEAGIKGVDAAMKKYDTLSTQAQSARKLMPSIDTALALMKDKNFYSGLGANEVLAWNKLKAALPSLFGEGAQFSAAPNEVFNKNIAGSILDNMRTALGGLGQVRLAEIDLLKQASASNNNTPAANRALLTLSKRALTQMDNLDQLGQAYQSGDEVTDPITGKVLLKANVNASGEPQPRRGLDVGYDKLARQFVLDHPTTSPKEAEEYKTLFGEDGTKTEGTTETPATGNVMTKEFDDGKGGKVTGVSTDGGKTWGPKK